MLTAREKEIIVLVAKGQSNKQMAATLGISHNTVATHMERIFEKLCVHERASVAVYAIRRGLVA